MAYPAALFLICAPPEAVAVVNAQESSAVASASVVETEEEPVAAVDGVRVVYRRGGAEPAQTTGFHTRAVRCRNLKT